jgi:hypothetical protein
MPAPNSTIAGTVRVSSARPVAQAFQACWSGAQAGLKALRHLTTRESRG